MSRYGKKLHDYICAFIGLIIMIVVINVSFQCTELYMGYQYLQYINWFIFALICLYAVAIVVAYVKYTQFYSADLQNIDRMNGHDFEYYCASLLKSNGYTNVKVTKGAGDFGADILARKNGLIYAIQCKRYSNKVGVKAVQEVTSGRLYYKCHKAVIITNNYYTKPAIQLANSTNVILWDRQILKKLLDADLGKGYENKQEEPKAIKKRKQNMQERQAVSKEKRLKDDDVTKELKNQYETNLSVSKIMNEAEEEMKNFFDVDHESYL